MINGHGGNIYKTARHINCLPSEIIDMSSNVNPVGPPEGLEDFLVDHIRMIQRLPEVDSESIISAFAQYYAIGKDSILSGNGTTEFIYLIPKVLKTKKALIIGPTYSDYADACIMNHVSHDFLISAEAKNFKPDINKIESAVSDYDTIFICNPNNPTGAFIHPEELAVLCKKHTDTYFIIDESYLPFVKHGDQISMMHYRLPNVVVLNSMSKIFNIPGLRIGFLIACHAIIKKFHFYCLPWSVNALAQASVSYLLGQKENTTAFIEKTIAFIEKEKHFFLTTLKNHNKITFYPSSTGFMLARLNPDYNADTLCKQLLESRILIRDCTNFKGLSNRFVRISLKTNDNNQNLANRLLQL